MKRFMIYCLVLAFIAAIPLSHSLMGARTPKYMICHITGEDGDNLTGHIIIVSGNAVPAHYKNGDHDPSCDLRKAGEYCWRPAAQDVKTRQHYKCEVE